MEIKELKIVPPEGYEIDNKKSTFERIVFKKKDDKPRTWEEFCERGFTGKEAYTTVGGVAKSFFVEGECRQTYAVGYVDNEQEAQAFIALMQLRQLRKAWVGDWEPDWCDDSPKYIISMEYNYISVWSAIHYSGAMSFPTNEMAVEFISCFRELLEQAKMVL